MPEQANVSPCLLRREACAICHCPSAQQMPNLCLASSNINLESRNALDYRAEDGLLIIEHCTLWPVMGSTIKNDKLCRRLSHGQSAWSVASATHRMAIPWKNNRWFSPMLSATGLSTTMRTRPCSIRMAMFLSTAQRRNLVARSSTSRSHGSGRGTCGCHCAN